VGRRAAAGPRVNARNMPPNTSTLQIPFNAGTGEVWVRVQVKAMVIGKAAGDGRKSRNMWCDSVVTGTRKPWGPSSRIESTRSEILWLRMARQEGACASTPTPDSRGFL
jgi:hypothetical protein